MHVEHDCLCGKGLKRALARRTSAFVLVTICQSSSAVFHNNHVDSQVNLLSPTGWRSCIWFVFLRETREAVLDMENKTCYVRFIFAMLLDRPS